MPEDRSLAKPENPAVPERTADSGWHLLRRKILTVPGFLATTAAAAAISWAINYAATAATVGSQPPVTVSVQTDPGRIPYFAEQSQSAVLPTRRDDGSPGRGCLGFYRWAVRNGGVSAPPMIQIVVQSQTSQAVYLSGMRVKVLRRAPKLAGPTVVCPTAGVAAFRPISINLDTAPPSVTYRHGRHEVPFGFTLTDGEEEVFEVTPYTRLAHYFFDIELDLIVGGQRQAVQVTDHGRPFQATVSGRGGWEWDYQKSWSKGRRTVLADRPFPPSN